MSRMSQVYLNGCVVVPQKVTSKRKYTYRGKSNNHHIFNTSHTLVVNILIECVNVMYFSEYSMCANVQA